MGTHKKKIQLDYIQTESIEDCFAVLDLIIRQVTHKDLDQIGLDHLDDLREAIVDIDAFYQEYKAHK